MRNTLILIGQIQTNQQHGLDPYHAVVEATVQRARPVILTALAAVLAFIPLTQSVFWGSMAYTLIGGTAVGTVLILVFLPALYAIWFRVRPLPAGYLGSAEQPTGNEAPLSAGPSRATSAVLQHAALRTSRRHCHNHPAQTVQIAKASAPRATIGAKRATAVHPIVDGRDQGRGMTAVGHQERFPLPNLSGSCGFG
jgi:hypothetical protein